MWSQSCEILNPYEAVMSELRHKELLKEQREAKTTSRIKTFFRNLFLIR